MPHLLFNLAFNFVISKNLQYRMPVDQTHGKKQTNGYEQGKVK